MAKKTGMYILLAGGTAIAVGAGVAYARGKKKKKKTKKVTGCNPAPYAWNEGAVSASIQSMIQDGQLDPAALSAAVASEHFGSYPSGGMQSFPPGPSPARGVSCVWSRVQSLVNQHLASAGPAPKPHEVVQKWIRDEPTPGFLYRVQPEQGMSMSKMAQQALANAGVPNPKNNNGVYVNSLNYRNMIECSPWNDALLNTADSGGKGGPDGRGISLNAVHDDNVTRMMMGQPPRRAATGKSSHDGGGHLPLVWLPAIEPGAPVPVLMEWNDGFMGINPPEEILAFGLENVFPGQYGCDPWREEAGGI